jgi:hypothetical protein
MGEVLDFHRDHCGLCGRAFAIDSRRRLPARAIREGWGCPCRGRKLALVAECITPVSPLVPPANE